GTVCVVVGEAVSVPSSPPETTAINATASTTIAATAPPISHTCLLDLPGCCCWAGQYPGDDGPPGPPWPAAQPPPDGYGWPAPAGPAAGPGGGGGGDAAGPAGIGCCQE